LTKWQKVHRLVGSTDVDWMAHNVIADSLSFLAALPPDMRTLADAGSGAGIPGVPIAIVREDLRVSLIEARQRRVSFLSAVVRELALHRVEVLGVRIEQLAETHANRFDAVVSRCAGASATILTRVLPIVRPGGAVVVSAAATSEVSPGGEALALRTPDGGTRRFHRYRKQ
jgi:16S rRNA (guanine527-N7)-methyltransferase